MSHSGNQFKYPAKCQQLALNNYQIYNNESMTHSGNQFKYPARSR